MVKKTRKSFIESDDLLKVAIVFAIGLLLGYLITTCSPAEKKDPKNDKYVLDVLLQLKDPKSSTNSALDIPFVRAGSGIR